MAANLLPLDQVPNFIPARTGKHNVPCPTCYTSRTKHKAKCATAWVDVDKITVFCHHCGDTLMYVNDPNRGKKGNPKELYTKEQRRAYMQERAIKERMQNNHPPTSTVPRSVLDASTNPKHYHTNPLYNWMLGLVATETTLLELFIRYHIGTAKGGGTVFWHMDKQHRIRQPKVMWYMASGKRDKTRHPYVPKQYQASNGYSPCLFGEHLLPTKYDATVVLVESEKTALIGSLWAPTMLWVAKGGAKGLTERKARSLQHRTVICWGDNDEPGREYAIKDVALIKSLHGTAEHCNYILENYPAGYDVADYVTERILTKKVTL